MSVVLETTKGEITIDLHVDEAPLACQNFLKLCACKYYNGVLFYNVQKDFVAQTGDPTGTGEGGTSVYGLMNGEKHRFFKDEISRKLTHAKAGTVAMANAGTANTNGSQFYITLRDGLEDQLDGKNTVFGEVVDGLEVLDVISNAYCDDGGRPYIDIRIKHTLVIDDPTDDIPGFDEKCPDESPELVRPTTEKVVERLQEGDDIDGTNGRTEEEIDEELKRQEAKTRARTLEILGDLPDADVAPPENVLFVCKLNPATKDADLEMIFSRFGEILSCEIIRDYKTGDSLNYAFIEFARQEDCEEAYFKMNNVLIDMRRIKVDFSQSVSRQWNKWMKQRRDKGGKGGAGAGRPAVTKGRVHGQATRLELQTHERKFAGAGKYDLLVGSGSGERSALGGGGGRSSGGVDPRKRSRPSDAPRRERDAGGSRGYGRDGSRRDSSRRDDGRSHRRDDRGHRHGHDRQRSDDAHRRDDRRRHDERREPKRARR